MSLQHSLFFPSLAPSLPFHLQAAVKASKGVYISKVVPGAVVPQQVGNMYCASVYGSLVSLVANKKTELVREGGREGVRTLVRVMISEEQREADSRHIEE